MNRIRGLIRRTNWTIVLFLMSVQSVAQEIPADGTILGYRPYEFPEYADARGYTRFDGSQDALRKYWTEAEYESAVSDNRFEFKKVIYSSDGLRVVAYIYKPKKVTAPLPVIVFNRGSAVHKDIAPVLVPYFHRLANEGFVVVAPMYRQTDGGEGIDANGGEDLNDLLNILPVIHELSYADSDNIFMTGESRGAMMVYQAIRENFPMRAAAVWGGFTDLQPLIDRQPMLLEYAKNTWPGFSEDKIPSEIARRSVIRWPEKIKSPILLMHGEGDRSIPVEHTYNLARELQKQKRLYGLIVFADDNHILQQNQEERDHAAIRWFRKFSTETQAADLHALRTSASEETVIDRAYSVLDRGNHELALELFRIGTERFPKSVNAYDSLGEALALSGDTEGALRSYRTALSLSTDKGDRTRIEAIMHDLRSGRDLH